MSKSSSESGEESVLARDDVRRCLRMVPAVVPALLHSAGEERLLRTEEGRESAAAARDRSGVVSSSKLTLLELEVDMA